MRQPCVAVERVRQPAGEAPLGAGVRRGSAPRGAPRSASASQRAISTTPRAAARARASGPTMPSEPVVSRLVSSGVPHCCVDEHVVGVVGVDRRRQRCQARRGTLMKSSSAGARSHSRRCRAEATSSEQRRRSAPTADAGRAPRGAGRATLWRGTSASSASYVARRVLPPRARVFACGWNAVDRHHDRARVPSQRGRSSGR